jgi:hypothetical protein
MSKIRSALAALAMLFIATIAWSQQAGVCAGYVPSGKGLTDGCSVPGAATWVFPDVGVFKSTFTPACVNHDHCYSSLGSNYNECNGNFLSDMKSACNSTYTVLSGPVYLACLDSASKYYQAVVGYSVAVNPLGGIQHDALIASQNLQTQVSAENCGTTPELSNLYDGSVISQVNTAFQSYAHRLPTIYEFLETVNDGDLTTDRAGWGSRVNQHAIAAATVTPPSVALTFYPYDGDYLVSTPTPLATYSWSGLIGLNASADGKQVNTLMVVPKYDATTVVGGVLRASILPPGATKPVRNQYILPQQTVTLYGWCAHNKNQHCL